MPTCLCYGFYFGGERTGAVKNLKRTSGFPTVCKLCGKDFLS